MNYDIHIGSLGGLVGKTIAFLASLICATLPFSRIFLGHGKSIEMRKPLQNQRYDRLKW